MAQYTMEDLKRLASLAEQGEHSGTSQYQNSSSTLHPPTPKADIRRDVYTAVMMSGTWVRRAEIASLLGLKKTPWLVAAIEELVEAGYLYKHVEQRENQLPITYYAVAR